MNIHFFQLINMISVSNDWRSGCERMFKHAQVCNMDHAGLGPEVRCVGWRGSEVCREVPGTFSSGCGVHILFFFRRKSLHSSWSHRHIHSPTRVMTKKKNHGSLLLELQHVAASQTRAPRRGARVFLQAVEHA